MGNWIRWWWNRDNYQLPAPPNVTSNLRYYVPIEKLAYKVAIAPI